MSAVVCRRTEYTPICKLHTNLCAGGAWSGGYQVCGRWVSLARDRPAHPTIARGAANTRTFWHGRRRNYRFVAALARYSTSIGILLE